MKIAAYFKYKDKKYLYVLDNNIIKFAYDDNKNINFNLTKEEIKLMKDTLSYISLSKNSLNHIDCGNFVHNNKKFKMIWDKYSKRYYFLEKGDKYLKSPRFDDLKFLMERFNPIINFSNKNDENLSKKEIFQKVKKLKDEIVVVTLEGMLIFLIGIGSLQFNEQLSHQNIEIEENIDNDNNNDILKYDKLDFENIINENTFLKLEEKIFIKSNLNILEQNKENINIDLIKNRLKTLKINYVSSDIEFIIGKYDSYLNEITIDKSSGFSKLDKAQKYVLLHELAHVFEASFNLGFGLKEAFTEQIAIEYDKYFNDDAFSTYKEERSFLYCLRELVGVEVLKKFGFNGDVDYLIDELKKINPDEEMAYKLLSNIDKISNYHYEISEKDKKEIEKYKLKKESLEIINKYFIYKYGYDAKYDPTMSIYLKQIMGIYYDDTNDINIYKSRGRKINYIKSKSFFCEEKNNNFIVVTYLDENGFWEEKINDVNREEVKEKINSIIAKKR